MRILFLLLAVFALLGLGCSGSLAQPTPVAVRFEPTPGPFELPEGYVDPAGLQRLEAEELRRLRAEHSSLIASVVTPTPDVPTPTPGPEVRHDVAVARVLAWPDGLPAEGPVDEDWFNPTEGVPFVRDGSGDWTPGRVRENHTHRALFYYDRYPPGVLNFHDGGMQREVAREMVFEMVRVLPLVDDPTPEMVDLFALRMGWELRDSPDPAVNFWTSFVYVKDSVEHEFVVAGVMLMDVGSTGEGEDAWEFLAPGRWIGPVVVERLR